jgi:ribulose-5-phosphate 4-epimerase/fuculose-1-phosphate aldolase
MTAEELRQVIADGCRVLAHRGVSDGIYGHISVRLGPDALLIRCRGPRERGLAWTSPHDVCAFTLDGVRLPTDAAPGGWAVPNEFPMHAEILRHRPDVEVVVHAHAEHVLAADLAGLGIRPILGSYDIPGAHLVRYGLPVYERSVLIRDRRLGREVVTALGDRPAVILRAHGFACTGRSVQQAVLRAISIDTIARISLLVTAAGGRLADIPDEDFAELPDLGSGFNIDTAWRHELARLPGESRSDDGR